VTTYQGDLIWEALADGTRRQILRQLATGPRAVGEIAESLPVSRPAVSQHLKVLRAAELVADAAVGTRRFYRLDHRGLDVLRAELDQFWGNALATYQDIVEGREPEPSEPGE